jgi:TPR repeat protein
MVLTKSLWHKKLRAVMIICALATGVVGCQSTNNSDGVKSGIIAQGQGDYKQAFQSWKSGAEAGNRTAQYALGQLYEQGNGIKQDIEKAIYWYGEAAKQGYHPAVSRMTALIRDGGNAAVSSSQVLSAQVSEPKQQTDALSSTKATAAASTTVADDDIRIALVIGNGSYDIAPLANPVNDARLIGQTLSKLGFSVHLHLNINQKVMKRTISDFGRRLGEAGDKAVGLFYYAGHGVQVNGENFMIPVGAKIDRESDVDIEGVSAETVTGAMEFADSRLNLVVLDACRNNPFTRSFRSGNRGLARMAAPRGTMIAYSTGPGDVAADGDGANSPYTQALAGAMNIPGIPIERAFKLVRINVAKKTNNRQVPWESSSLTGEFYFKIP